MFLHLGNNVVINSNKIIGIFDLQDDLSSINRDLKENILFVDKKKSFASKKEIKSCVLTDDSVYFSHISSGTLKKRAENILSNFV